MLQKTSFLAALLWLALPARPSYAQDQTDQPPQPSLGDIARQARKDKEKNAVKSKTVITEENLPSSNGLSGLSSEFGGPQGAGDSGSMAKALAKVQEAEAGLRKLESVDRSTLAKVVLLDHDVDFPNRRAWEDRLYAAKERYVSHEGELLGELKQIAAQLQSHEASHGKLDPKDPGTQQMKNRLLEIIQDAMRTEQGYRAVVMEGWDLARQAKY